MTDTIKVLSRLHKILIVDDEPDIVELLESVIDKIFGNVKIFKAADGTEANLKIRNDQFDVVITDLKMPKLGGMELVKQINKNNFGQKIKTKIVVFSGTLSKENITEILQTDKTVKMFAKPLQAEQFIEYLKANLE